MIQQIGVVSLCMCLFLWRPAVSLTCYQQTYTPGISSNNLLTGGGLNTGLNNQQQQQQYTNYGQMALPTITCSTTATSCYKFVCFGTTSWTMKGCLDYSQPQYSCQSMDAQCLGGQGNCYVCNGNNCNGALSLRSQSATTLLTFLVAISIGAYFFKNNN